MRVAARDERRSFLSWKKACATSKASRTFILSITSTRAGRRFLKCFAEADLITAKGQGNFETLSDGPRNVFFLFKAKCSVIAAHAGVPTGTHVLARSRAGIAGSGCAS